MVQELTNIVGYFHCQSATAISDPMHALHGGTDDEEP